MRFDATMAAAGEVTVTVGAGDSLSKIAATYGMTWQELYAANRDVVGDNPNLIHAGQELRLPGSEDFGRSRPAADTTRGAQALGAGPGGYPNHPSAVQSVPPGGLENEHETAAYGGGPEMPNSVQGVPPGGLEAERDPITNRVIEIDRALAEGEAMGLELRAIQAQPASAATMAQVSQALQQLEVEQAELRQERERLLGR